MAATVAGAKRAKVPSRVSGMAALDVVHTRIESQKTGIGAMKRDTYMMLFGISVPTSPGPSGLCVCCKKIFKSSRSDKECWSQCSKIS